MPLLIRRGFSVDALVAAKKSSSQESFPRLTVVKAYRVPQMEKVVSAGVVGRKQRSLWPPIPAVEAVMMFTIVCQRSFQKPKKQNAMGVLEARRTALWTKEVLIHPRAR